MERGRKTQKGSSAKSYRKSFRINSKKTWVKIQFKLEAHSWVNIFFALLLSPCSTTLSLFNSIFRYLYRKYINVFVWILSKTDRETWPELQMRFYWFFLIIWLQTAIFKKTCVIVITCSKRLLKAYFCERPHATITFSYK